MLLRVTKMSRFFAVSEASIFTKKTAASTTESAPRTLICAGHVTVAHLLQAAAIAFGVSMFSLSQSGGGDGETDGDESKEETKTQARRLVFVNVLKSRRHHFFVLFFLAPQKGRRTFSS